MSASRLPIHDRIACALRDRLAVGYAPGDRFASQNELAQEFGVSPITAREAVARLVQEGLLERRVGSGTFVCNTKPERYIGILTELDIAHPDLSPFYNRLIQAMRRRLAAEGYMTRLYVGHNPPYGSPVPPTITNDEFWMDVQAERLLGVLLVANDAAWFQGALAPRQLPVAGATTRDGHPLVDYEALVRQGVAYLVEAGCQRPGCIDLTADGGPSRRLDHFMAELLRAGLAAVPERTGTCVLGRDAGRSPQGVFSRLWALDERPDGLLVLDDIIYRQLAPLLLYNSIDVPHDLVVVSHLNRGDDPSLHPTPVGLVIDPDDVADRMTTTLLAQLPGEAEAGAATSVPIRLTMPATGTLELFTTTHE